jgi:hypothetical protein
LEPGRDGVEVAGADQAGERPVGRQPELLAHQVERPAGVVSPERRREELGAAEGDLRNVCCLRREHPREVGGLADDHVERGVLHARQQVLGLAEHHVDAVSAFRGGPTMPSGIGEAGVETRREGLQAQIADIVEETLRGGELDMMTERRQGPGQRDHRVQVAEERATAEEEPHRGTSAVDRVVRRLPLG